MAEEESYFGNRNRRVTVERISSDAMVVTLFIPRVAGADAGIYTCSPDALPVDAITVHVINGGYLHSLLCLFFLFINRFTPRSH